MVWLVTPVTPPLEKVKETLCVTVLEGILAFMVQRVEKPLFLLVNVTLKRAPFTVVSRLPEEGFVRLYVLLPILISRFVRIEAASTFI